jgi:hypothetical protein
MMRTALARVAVVACAVLAVACGDPTRPRATYANAQSFYTLYALTGGPASAPNAVSFLGGPTRATAAGTFDLAFDLDASGKPVIYPVRLVIGSLVGYVKRVGLQVVPGSFETIREVPATGYDTLNAKSVSPGTVLAVEMLEVGQFSACFASIFSQQVYAKVVIDSVNVPNRRIYARSVVDPNCGYRSVVPDSVPES